MLVGTTSIKAAKQTVYMKMFCEYIKNKFLFVLFLPINLQLVTLDVLYMVYFSSMQNAVCSA